MQDLTVSTQVNQKRSNNIDVNKPNDIVSSKKFSKFINSSEKNYQSVAPSTPKNLQGFRFTKQQAFKLKPSDFSNKDILFLAKQSLGDEAVKQIALNLKNNTSVKHLILGHNGLTSFAAAALADLLKVNHFIGWLVLNNNKLGLFGAQYLSQGLKKNKGVKHLILDENDLLDEGLIELLRNTPQDSKLETLTLKGNHLQDGCSEAILVFISTHSHLKCLDLRQNHFSKKKLNQFKDFSKNMKLNLYC